MLDRLPAGQDWLDVLLPEGLPIPSTTIISGPGGSGKPLIGAIILASWLRHGGSALVFLINSDRTYAERLLTLYGINPSEYKSRLVYVDFDPSFDSIDQVQPDLIISNILKPHLLEKSIRAGVDILKSTKADVMLYGAALNILFFSPTWGEKIFEKWKTILSRQGRYTSVFSVSTSAFRDKIQQLEELADNLMYSRIDKPMKLLFRIAKIKTVQFISEEVKVPLSREILLNLKAESSRLRKRIIPMVSSI